MGEIPGPGLLPILTSRAPLACAELTYTIKETSNVLRESARTSATENHGNDSRIDSESRQEPEMNSLIAAPCQQEPETETSPLCDLPSTPRVNDDSNLERIESVRLDRRRSKRSSSKSQNRKVSLEKRLRRRFTIKDEHTNLVTKRMIALIIKYSLFVFNFCSWVIATTAVGIGVWVLTDKGKIVTDGTDFFIDPTIMIVIVGGITFFVAFVGCLGALRENLVLLRVFFVILSVILLGEVIVGVTIFVIYTVPEARENFLRSTPEKVLRSAILRYMDDTDIKKWMDLIQQEFRCCGIGLADEGFRDWQLNMYFNCTDTNRSIFRCAVPQSCCIFEPGDRINIMCGFEITDKPLVDVRDYIYTRGCIHGFGEWLGKHDELIIIAALSILVMQLLAVISAKIMVTRITRQRQRWESLHRSSTSSTHADS